MRDRSLQAVASSSTARTRIVTGGSKKPAMTPSPVSPEKIWPALLIRLLENPGPRFLDKAESIVPKGFVIAPRMNYFGFTNVFVTVIHEMDVESTIGRKLIR